MGWQTDRQKDRHGLVDKETDRHAYRPQTRHPRQHTYASRLVGVFEADTLHTGQPGQRWTQLDLVLLLLPAAFQGLAIATTTAANAAAASFVVVIVVVDVVAVSRVRGLILVADLGFLLALHGEREFLALLASYTHTTSRHQGTSQSTPPPPQARHNVNAGHGEGAGLHHSISQVHRLHHNVSARQKRTALSCMAATCQRQGESERIIISRHILRHTPRHNNA